LSLRRDEEGTEPWETHSHIANAIRQTFIEAGRVSENRSVGTLYSYSVFETGFVTAAIGAGNYARVSEGTGAMGTMLCLAAAYCVHTE
jgi:hypothetical protein